MMSDWLFAMLQATVVLAVATCVARVSMKKDPVFSARAGILGIALAAVIPATAVLQLPKPWSIDVSGWLTQTRGSSTALDVRASVPDDEHGWNGKGKEWQPLNTTNALELPTLRGGALHLPSAWFSDTSNFDLRPLSACMQFVVFLCAFFLLCRVLLGIFSVGMMLRSSVELPRCSWPREFLELQGKHERFRKIQIRLHESIESPCVHALSSRVIFVPSDFLEWSPIEIRTVIAHETAHLVRQDPWQRLIGDVAIAILVGHPFAWILHRQVCDAQEMATDRSAAQCMRGLSEYRRGLALLCLRFDQNQFSFRKNGLRSLTLVGISNRLIRRIKMLPSQTEVPSRSAKTMNQLLLAGLTLVALAVGGWELQADDPIRVAALPTSKVEEKQGTSFQRPKEISQSGLSATNGLIELRPKEAAEHPIVATLLSMLEGHANKLMKSRSDGQPQTLSDFGMTLAGLERVQLIPQVSFSVDPEAEDNPHQLSVGASSFLIEAGNVIQWPSLLREISIAQFGAVEQPVWNQFAESQKVGTELRLENGDAEGVIPLAQATGLWQRVSGGVFTAIAPIPQTAELIDLEAATSQGLDPFEQQSLELLRKLSAVGVGIDIQPDAPALNARVAFVGMEGQTQDSLEAQVRLWIASAAEQLDGDNVASQAVARNLREATFASETLDTKYASITVNFVVDPLVLATLSF